MRARAATVLVVVVGVVFVVGAATGCHTFEAQLPGALRTDVPPERIEKVGALDVTATHTFFLCGLVGQPPPTLLADPIKKQVMRHGADGVAHLHYQSTQTLGDVAFQTCTLGFASPRTYHVSGDIVRIRAERLPGRPAKLVMAY